MTTKHDNQSLAQMAEQIKESLNQADEHLNQADQKTVEAALIVVTAKKHVKEGHAGPDAKWDEWVDAYLGLKKTRIDELLSIGRADDPLARAQEIREKAKARAKKHRDKKKTEPRSRNGDEGDVPTPEPETATEPEEGDTETAPEPKPQPEPKSPDHQERSELIETFTEWANNAEIDELRRVVDSVLPKQKQAA